MVDGGEILYDLPYCDELPFECPAEGCPVVTSSDSSGILTN